MRKLAEILALAALAALCWLTWSALAGPNRLPDKVPTHFDAAGNANAWGSPSGMILIPIIAAGLYVLLTIVARFPSAFHYPVRTTPVNLPRLQAITLGMVAWIKAEMLCLFAVLQGVFIQAARSGNGALFGKVMPVFLVVIFGTIGLHFVALFRAARS
jgi:uncharacterized membrane protein